MATLKWAGNALNIQKSDSDSIQLNFGAASKTHTDMSRYIDMAKYGKNQPFHAGRGDARA